MENTLPVLQLYPVKNRIFISWRSIKYPGVLVLMIILACILSYPDNARANNVDQLYMGIEGNNTLLIRQLKIQSGTPLKKANAAIPRNESFPGSRHIELKNSVDAGAEIAIETFIENWGQKPAQNVIVDFIVNGKVISQQVVRGIPARTIVPVQAKWREAYSGERYENQETGYMLDRIEAHNNPSVLASNLRHHNIKVMLTFAGEVQDSANAILEIKPLIQPGNPAGKNLSFDELDQETGAGKSHNQKLFQNHRFSTQSTDPADKAFEELDEATGEGAKGAMRHPAAPDASRNQYILRKRTNNPELMVDHNLWRQPHITSCPASAFVGDVIRIEGRALGDPLQMDKTEVIFPYSQYDSLILRGEITSISSGLSGTFRGLEVIVPRGAVKSRIKVNTPGGLSECPGLFNPVYLFHLSPDILTPEGQLNYLSVYDSRIMLADGENNSIFNVSEQMKSVLDLEDFIFTFPRYEERVDLLVGSTILRVRIPGSQTGYEHRDKTIRSSAPDVRINGEKVIFNIPFESEGAEFIGEYETQELFTGNIYWKHFMNINIDNLNISMIIPLNAITPSRYAPYHKYNVELGEVDVSVSFDTSFNIFEMINFEVNKPSIVELIRSSVAELMKSYIKNSAFKLHFEHFMTAYIKTYFKNEPVHRITINSAEDGGMDIRGFTRPE